MTQSDAVGRPVAAPAGLRPLLLGTTFLVAYVLLEWVSFIHEYKGLPITPWNPGLGVVFALMLAAGARFALVLFLGVLIAEVAVLRSNLSWPVILGIATVIAAAYGAAAAVVRRWIEVSLQHLRDLFALFVAGTVGATLVAVLLSVLLTADAQLELSDVLVAAGPLLLGDVIGIAVMTPLTLRFFLRDPPVNLLSLRAAAPEIAIYIVIVALILWFISLTENESGFKLFYLAFLPVVMAAVRHGLDGTCLGLALTQFGLVGLLHWHGYDANVFTEFQILMLLLTATGLTVGVTVSERQQADRLTREVEARLRAQEAEAAQAARFNLVGGMASALAHEINQPITAARALGRAAQHLLGEHPPDHARAAGNLGLMISQIDHAAGVVRRMRDFLRRGEPHVSTLDVKALIEEALLLIGAEASSRKVRIEFEAPNPPLSIHADRVQLQQVILNLVQNSIDAIVAAGRADERIRITATAHSDPDRVEIGVVDNGPGMAPELSKRLFEPLTTSKQDGLGLGLSICATIVQSHHGRLWLQSGAPGATEFRLSLPREQTM